MPTLAQFLQIAQNNNNLMSDIKEKLFILCHDYIANRVSVIKQNVAELQEAANDDTKSSAGDKFEVGREKLGAGGVVRDASLRKAAVQEVADSAYDMGLGCLGVVASTLPGPSGNVEYFLWLKKGASEISESALDLAISEGPQ